VKLAELVKRLRAMHGDIAPVSTDPWELIVHENCAYLVPPKTRQERFLALKKKTGLKPQALLRSAEPKLRRCAEMLIELGRDALFDRKALKKFPGVGEPGADKLLLFSRKAKSLAPDSNGLRVLLRLGLGAEDKSYAKSYRSAAEAVAPLPDDWELLIAAQLLLQRHGQTLCRRSAPKCEVCALAKDCAFRQG